MAPTVARRSATLIVISAAAMSLLLTTASAASAVPIRPSAEAHMVSKINAVRSAYGLAPLHTNLQMTRLARQWARSMYRQANVYHRPDLADVVYGDYSRLGENVGFTRLEGATDELLVDRLHAAFVESTGHFAQIIGDYNQVGVGIYRASGGRMYVAVNFIRGPLDEFPLYRDYTSSPHRAAIAKLFVRGAVKGCSASRFCPAAPGTRNYVAATIDRAASIRRASSYVSSSCGTSYSCRYAEITRGELAAMLTEALGLAGSTRYRFSDVSSTRRAAVNAVVDAGIMSGCSTTRFCPGRTVTRGAAAAIVHRAILG